jgi:imidazolonepropionase-like amidohydrolase
MPAQDALASATGVAARACGLEGRTGMRRGGHDADLLMLDDPSGDVTRLRWPRVAVCRGREVDLGG